MKKKCRYRSKTSSMLSEELTRASVWGKETLNIDVGEVPPWCLAPLSFLDSEYGVLFWQ